jgi:hypothetical protein
MQKKGAIFGSLFLKFNAPHCETVMLSALAVLLVA